LGVDCPKVAVRGADIVAPVDAEMVMVLIVLRYANMDLHKKMIAKIGVFIIIVKLQNLLVMEIVKVHVLRLQHLI